MSEKMGMLGGVLKRREPFGYPNFLEAMDKYV